EKSSLFATASTKQELTDLSLFRVVLGTIYEKRPGRPGSAQTAAFQWEHAIRAEDRIRHDDKNYLASPLLRQRLASAYLADGKPDDAWKYGREAMHLLVDAGQLNTARQYHGELTARDSPWKLPDDKRAHLTGLLSTGTKDANAVIAKAIKALGGEEKLNKALQGCSWKTKGTLSTMGNDNLFSTDNTLK